MIPEINALGEVFPETVVMRVDPLMFVPPARLSWQMTREDYDETTKYYYAVDIATAESGLGLGVSEMPRIDRILVTPTDLS